MASAQGADDQSFPVARTRRLKMLLIPAPEVVAHVRSALERLDLPPEALADAQLLVSELVTNGIRHGGLGPEERILLTAERDPSTLRITVRDRTDGNGPLSVAGAIRPAPGAESGWGLFLVDQLSDAWGVERQGGANVWFELQRQRDDDAGDADRQVA